jgi:hypothetical protein
MKLAREERAIPGQETAFNHGCAAWPLIEAMRRLHGEPKVPGR